MERKKCTNCGRIVWDDDSKCPGCGNVFFEKTNAEYASDRPECIDWERVRKLEGK